MKLNAPETAAQIAIWYGGLPLSVRAAFADAYWPDRDDEAAPADLMDYPLNIIAEVVARAQGSVVPLDERDHVRFVEFEWLMTVFVDPKFVERFYRLVACERAAARADGPLH